MPASVFTSADDDICHRTAPFRPAGLQSVEVDLVADVSWPTAYAHRVVGAARAKTLDSDPNNVRPPGHLRMLAHAISTFVVVLVAGLVIIALTPQLLGYDSVVVVSGSMAPAIQVADIVVTAQPDGTRLGDGAVINFERDEGTVLHRIVTSSDAGYTTKGDANAVADSQIVETEDIRGVGIVIVPLVGLPRTWVDEGQWHYLAILVVVTIAALHMSRVSWLADKQWPYR